MIACVYPNGVLYLGEFAAGLMVIDGSTQKAAVAAGMVLSPEQFIVPGDAQAKREVEAAGQHFGFVAADIRVREHLASYVLLFDQISIHEANLWGMLPSSAEIPNDAA